MNQTTPSRARIRQDAGGRGRLRVGIASSALWLAACLCACRAQPPMPGGYATAAVTNQEVVAAAKFAVAAEAKALQKDTPAAQLDLVSIVRAEAQVVAGMNYRLQLKVRHNGTEKAAEAVVWWQAWNQQTPYQLTSWNWK